MFILAICTVGDVCEAACLDTVTGAATLASEPMKTGHDARIAVLVQQAVEQSGKPMSAIDRIAVVSGPGSFTGVRVGVAIARGLALALDRPAVGVTTLEAMAPNAGRGPLLSLLPAKRRPPALTWWAQRIDASGQGEGEPVEADAAQILSMAEGLPVVIGQGLDGQDLGGAIVRAAAPGALNACLHASRLGAGSLPPARPIYVREPDAAPMVRP